MFSKATILGLATGLILTTASCGGGSIGFIPDDDTAPELNVSGVEDEGQYGIFAAGPDELNISAVATDESGIAAMSMRINGTLVSSSNDGNLGYAWDTADSPTGAYELTFEATDMNGNTTTQSLTVNVYNIIVLNPDLPLDFPDFVFEL